MNKPIPAIQKQIKEIIRDACYKAWYFGEREHNAHIYTDKIIALHNAELLNERERILKEVEEKVLKGIDMNTDDFGQYDYKGLGSYMFNLLGFLERLKSEKEGGE
jgi:hypothetical protein